MTSGFGQAARTLVAGQPGDVDSSALVAERAAKAFDQLAKHLARLLGDAGVQLLLKRSIAKASAQFAWLSAGASTDPATLQGVMENQDPESITEAFVAVLSAFVGLLERLIGEGLVARLLDEVWPTVFKQPAKDTP